MTTTTTTTTTLSGMSDPKPELSLEQEEHRAFSHSLISSRITKLREGQAKWHGYHCGHDWFYNWQNENGASDKDLIWLCQDARQGGPEGLKDLLDHAQKGAFYKIHIAVPDDQILTVLEILRDNLPYFFGLIYAFKHLIANMKDRSSEDGSFIPTVVFYAQKGKAQKLLDLCVKLFGNLGEFDMKPQYNVHVKGPVHYAGGSRDLKVEMRKNAQRTAEKLVAGETPVNHWEKLLNEVFEDDLKHYRGQPPLKISKA